jgi:hypothetical protein
MLSAFAVSHLDKDRKSRLVENSADGETKLESASKCKYKSLSGDKMQVKFSEL